MGTEEGRHVSLCEKELGIQREQSRVIPLHTNYHTPMIDEHCVFVGRNKVWWTRKTGGRKWVRATSLPDAWREHTEFSWLGLVPETFGSRAPEGNFGDPPSIHSHTGQEYHLIRRHTQTCSHGCAREGLHILDTHSHI